ncbi:MAG: hypothetical protein AB7O66_07600 [Limisphaerales bacterium]
MKILKVLKMTAAISIDSRVELQKHLVQPTEEADPKAGTVIARRETAGEPVRQAAAEQGVIRHFRVQPALRQIELDPDILGRFQQPIRQRSRVHDIASLNAAEDVDVARRGTTYESKRKQRRPPAHDQVLHRVLLQIHQLSQELKRPLQHTLIESIHLTLKKIKMVVLNKNKQLLCI